MLLDVRVPPKNKINKNIQQTFNFE
jgi:hypothetical protein